MTKLVLRYWPEALKYAATSANPRKCLQSASSSDSTRTILKRNYRSVTARCGISERSASHLLRHGQCKVPTFSVARRHQSSSPPAPNEPAPIQVVEQSTSSPSPEATASKPSAPAISSHNTSSSSVPPHTSVMMPDIAESHIVGSVTQWYKKEGDAVVYDDVLCEIETENLVVDVEAPVRGFIARIVVPAGSQNVPVGQTLAIIVEDESAKTAFQDVKTYGASDKAAEEKKEGSQSSEVLKLLNALRTENKVTDDASFSKLKSLAMHDDPKLIIIYNANAVKNSDGSVTVDEAGFLANALQLLNKEKVDSAGAVDVLRTLNVLFKEGKLPDKEHQKILKKLARHKDAALMVTYSSSFSGVDESEFDAEAFIEGCEDIVEDYLDSQKGSTPSTT